MPTLKELDFSRIGQPKTPALRELDFSRIEPAPKTSYDSMLEAARMALSDKPIPEPTQPSQVIGQVRLPSTNEQADSLVKRFGKQLYNSFARIGQNIISSPLSPIGIPRKEAEQYRVQATKELEASGFVGGAAQAEELIRARSAALAASERVPTFGVTPAERTAEKVADVAAGLTAFLSQLALTRRVLPKGTSEPIIWEVQNQLAGGVPGEGAAMASAFGAIGKIPAVSIPGKVAKVGAQSTLLGGIAAAAGGDTEDVIIASLVPVAFGAYRSARGKISDAQMVRAWRQKLPFTRDIPMKSSLKYAQAMRAAFDVGGTKDFRLKGKKYQQWHKRYGQSVDTFLKQADAAFRKTMPAKPAGLLPAEIAEKPPRIAPEAITPTEADKVVTRAQWGIRLKNGEIIKGDFEQYTNHADLATRKNINLDEIESAGFYYPETGKYATQTKEIEKQERVESIKRKAVEAPAPAVEKPAEAKIGKASEAAKDLEMPKRYWALTDVPIISSAEITKARFDPFDPEYPKGKIIIPSGQPLEAIDMIRHEIEHAYEFNQLGKYTEARPTLRTLTDLIARRKGQVTDKDIQKAVQASEVEAELKEKIIKKAIRYRDFIVEKPAEGKDVTERFFEKEKPIKTMTMEERKALGTEKPQRPITLEEYRERLRAQEGHQIRVLESQPDIGDELAKMAIIRAKLGDIRQAKQELQAAISNQKTAGVQTLKEAKETVTQAEKWAQEALAKEKPAEEIINYEQLVAKWGEDKVTEAQIFLSDENEEYQDIEGEFFELDEQGKGETPEGLRLQGQLNKMVDDFLTAEPTPPVEPTVKGIFGQPVFDAISGKQLDLGLAEIEKRPEALKEVNIKPELARQVGKILSEKDAPTDPQSLYVDQLAGPEFRDLFINPDNPLPEVRTAWNEAFLGRTFLPKETPEVGIKEAAVVETGMTDEQRSKYIRQIEQQIQQNPAYQSVAEGYEVAAREIDVGYYYVPKKLKGEVLGITGQPGKKGFNLALYKHFTFDPTKGATDWTKALQERGIEEMDITEFVQRVQQAMEGRKKAGILSEQAYQKALEQVDPELQILDDIRYGLKSGKSVKEINENTLAWAEEYGLSEDDVSELLLKELTDEQIGREAEKARVKDQEMEKLEAKRLREKEKRTAAEQKRLKEIIARQEKAAAEKAAQEKQLKALRKQVHAIAAKKGLTKKQFQELKRKVTKSGKAISTLRMSLDELKAFVEKVKKARPKRIGYKQVITKKTENKIQSLKETLIKKEHLSEQRFADILEIEVRGKEPKYIDAQNFITEQQGKEIIQRMNDEAEIAKTVLPYQKAVEGNAVARGIVNKIREAAAKHKRMPRIVESTRYYFAQAQNITDEPFAYIFKDLEDTHLELEKVRKEFFDSMLEDVPNLQTEILSNKKALKRIEAYILSKSNLRDKPEYPEDITENELKIAKKFEDNYKKYQLDARLARFKNWYEAGKPEAGIDAIPQYDQYRREINKAVDIYESQGEEALVEYLKTQEWGVIRSGYDPIMNIFRPKVAARRPSPMTIGKGRIRTRTSIEYHPQETNIFQRTSRYMRNMDLLAKMRPKIRSFVRLAEDNAERFDKPKVFIRSVEDYIQALKGYNIHENYISKILAAFYAQAARARLAISLRISLLNSIEAPAFNVDKSTLIDPRNKGLSREDHEWFETYVNQMEPMLREFMMVTTKPVLEYVPVVRRPIKFLNELAKRYAPMAYFDKFSRLWSFWARFNQVKRATKTDDLEQIYKDSKINDYTEAEQEIAMSILAKDGKEAFARYVARTHVEKTHYLYSREQRSPFELNHARVWSNLMTFSRSWSERIAKATGGILKRKYTLSQRRRNLKILVSVLGGAWLLGEIYRMVMRTKRNPYDPRYIIDYELGGLALGAFDSVNELWQTLLRASAGDEKAVALLPMVITKVPDVLVPFYMYVIRAAESLTGRKYIDRELLRALREAFDKDYKRRPDAYKAKRTTIEKITRMIEGRSVDMEIEERKKKKKTAY